MDLYDKRIKIEETKQLIDNMINTTIKDIECNTTIVTTIIKTHEDFVSFCETLNIFELERWDKIKEDYNNIKKKVNKDKKIYKSIVKLYSDIINYYTTENIANYNKLIKNIMDLNDMMVYCFMRLQKIHKDVNIAHYKNNNIYVKIDKLSDDQCHRSQLLYDEIKQNNKQLYNNKNLKKKYKL